MLTVLANSSGVGPMKLGVTAYRRLYGKQHYREVEPLPHSYLSMQFIFFIAHCFLK
jgi:hypothetical protein